MTLKLTPQEAEDKIRRIEGARDQAVAKLRQINDTQTSMLSSSWQGGSATKYGRTADMQNDAFHGIIQTLNNVVELGSHHMRSVAASDGNS